MSAVFGIWVVVILVRWVLPWLWGRFSPGQARDREEWIPRGRVRGHRGPNARAFAGRAGRREWWLSTLVNSIISGIVGAVPTIGVLLSLPWIIANLAVNARRLHDLSLSAWLQLIPMAFGFAAVLAFFYLGGSENPPPTSFDVTTSAGLFTAFAILTGALYLIFYVVIGLFPGRPGPNAYGEADPV